MCEECLQHPCHPRCPNAPDPPMVYVCSGCGDPILAGEDYYDLVGEQFCEGCVLEARKVAVYDPY